MDLKEWDHPSGAGSEHLAFPFKYGGDWVSVRNKAEVNWEAHCLLVPLLSELWKSPGFLERPGEVWGRP